MVVAAIVLLIAGLFSALIGYKIARIALPIVSLFAGLIVGFSGVQAVFGTGVVSVAVGVVMAVVVGVIMMLLSFALFDLAVIVLTAALGAAAASFLGVTLGLQEDGFVTLLLGLSGAVLGLMVAINVGITDSLVVYITSFLGSAYILVAVMLLVGEVNLDQIQDTSILQVLRQEIDQSFLWFVAWAAGGIIAGGIQKKAIAEEVELFGDTLSFSQISNKRRL